MHAWETDFLCYKQEVLSHLSQTPLLVKKKHFADRGVTLSLAYLAVRYRYQICSQIQDKLQPKSNKDDIKHFLR